MVCQGHPALARGGNEIAAYELFRQLAAVPGHDAWFLGCHAGGQEAGVELRGRITQPFGEREYVYAPPTADWFRFANRDPQFAPEFVALLAALAPDIVHFHGFGNVGIEAPGIARRARPEARILLTLHEYAAICAHHGQMVKRPGRELCYGASLAACSRCFPEHGPSGMFLRESYIRLGLEAVDRFIAPSAFLRERFIAWGIEPERIVHVPNVVAPVAEPEAAASSKREPDGRFRVGFFGKVTPMKGIGVLLEAARVLHQGGNRVVQFDIHGTLDGQPEEMRAETLRLLNTATPNVRVRGAYAPEEVDRLMQATDAVVVPSIWWENAPVVIEEARRNGRPVICSDIGGMAEAVRDGIGGERFPAGDADALAELLDRVAAMPYSLSVTTLPRAFPCETMSEHMEVYRTVPRRV